MTGKRRRLGVGRGLLLFAKGLAGDIREQRRRPGRCDAAGPRFRPRALDPRVRRPVFVIGSPRSGTTFLGEALSHVSELSYHFEPRLTKAAAGLVYDGSWSARRAAPVFSLFYAALLLVNGDGGKRFAEKNPENCFIAPFLASTFADAVFVHIVRDGRDAAVSHAEKPWLRAASRHSGRKGRGGATWGPNARFWVKSARRAEFEAGSDLARTAWAWRQFTGAACEGLGRIDADRWTRLRYEDVVRDPDGTAVALAGFLGFDESGLGQLRRGLAAASVSSVGRWRKAVPEEAQQALTEACGPLLAELGYR